MIIYMAGSGRHAEDIKSFEAEDTDYGVLLSFFDMSSARFMRLEAKIKGRSCADTKKKVARSIKRS